MKRHGWITPLPGGAVARCGGPAICSICQAEAAALKRADDRRRPHTDDPRMKLPPREEQKPL